MLHELGHTIGLKDDYLDDTSIMYYIDIVGVGISPVDAENVRNLYYPFQE